MTTTYTFDQLKEDVRKEAEALRVHATEEERGRLNAMTIVPYGNKNDMYSQMTGEFDSSRAIELKQKCAVAIGSHECFAKFSWTPIEFYALSSEARNANLIAFLRGETDNLEL
jgi:hypothetical protein